MNRKSAGTGRACLPLFCPGVKAVDIHGDYVENNTCKGNIQLYILNK